MRIHCEVNGTRRDLDVDPLARLLDVLRDDLGLVGTKEGCGEGECGACTVLLDGAAVASCLVPACHVDGRRIVTVEGLAPDGTLSAVQAALIDHGAIQCGFCTPGIAMLATAALEHEPGASRERLREVLAGNLCRCTGYQMIVDAVADAVATSAGREGSR
ncbi:MAG TPA: (2Fe-2S)-binding protein [Acidimicrobiales bacterium]|nr:(2Fe-2S)-binding protein [Acidimicrobiales bacterium]